MNYSPSPLLFANKQLCFNQNICITENCSSRSNLIDAKKKIQTLHTKKIEVEESERRLKKMKGSRKR